VSLASLEIDDLATMALDRPAAAYLVSLSSPLSRYQMSKRLDKAARELQMSKRLDKGCSGPFLYRASWDTAPWCRLEAGQVQELTTGLAGRYSASYVNTILMAIRGVVRASNDLGLMDAEAMALILRVKPVAGGPVQGVAGRYVAAPERDRLMQAALDDPTDAGRRDGAILACAYPGGLRRSEIAGLQREDVVLDGDLVVLTVLGKGRKKRRVPLDGGGAHVLRDWLVVRGSAPGPLFCRGLRFGHLVMGSGLTPKSVGGIIGRLAVRAGVKKLTPHDLRRTVASDGLDRTDAVTVARLLGHASTQTTAKYDRRGDRAVLKVAAGLAIAYERS